MLVFGGGELALFGLEEGNGAWKHENMPETCGFLMRR
jgi:hypothetical protein